MKKYEYFSTFNYKPVLEFLNAMGQGSWLLIQQYKDQNLFIFAREIVEESDETV